MVKYINLKIQNIFDMIVVRYIYKVLGKREDIRKKDGGVAIWQ